MDRDREEGYFERQAKTMDIIGTYVVEDAPSKVDLSEECRVRILASEVSRQVPSYSSTCSWSLGILMFSISRVLLVHLGAAL